MNLASMCRQLQSLIIDINFKLIKIFANTHQSQLNRLFNRQKPNPQLPTSNGQSWTHLIERIRTSKVAAVIFKYKSKCSFFRRIYFFERPPKLLFLPSDTLQIFSMNNDNFLKILCRELLERSLFLYL